MLTSVSKQKLKQKLNQNPDVDIGEGLLFHWGPKDMARSEHSERLLIELGMAARAKKVYTFLGGIQRINQHARHL